MLCFVSLQCFFHFPRAGPQCFGGVTLFDNSLLSALIVFFFLSVCVFSCLADMMFLPPPPNPPSKSLSRKFVMYAFVQFTRKRNENTCQSDFEKSFFFPLPAEERTSLWQKRVKKAWEKQPRDGWWGAGNYRQHTRRCTERISHIHTHTHSPIYAYMLKTLAMWDNLEFLFLRIHSSQNPVKPPLLGILINILYRKYTHSHTHTHTHTHTNTHSPTDTHRLQQNWLPHASTDEAQPSPVYS